MCTHSNKQVVIIMVVDSSVHHNYVNVIHHVNHLVIAVMILMNYVEMEILKNVHMLHSLYSVLG